MKRTRLAIFASGTGSNAINLIRTFQNDDSIEVAYVLSNREDAGIVQSAKAEGIEVVVINNQTAADGAALIDLCELHDVQWIVLAGYLRLIPTELVRHFDRKMINLHPSLLPKYGGKGMHGRNVHIAVLENEELRTGITIHFVNEKFDEGEIIAQFQCSLKGVKNVEQIEAKIRVLEQSYLPIVVKNSILNDLK